MTIRLAENSDLVLIARLRWDFKSADGDVAVLSRSEFEKKCAEKLRAESEQWAHFLAFENQTAIGMVSICRVPKILSPDLKSDSVGYLTNTYVEADFRNKQVGQQLLEFARNWANENNFELLIVWPSDRSRSFYRRLGFNEDNEIMELLF